MKRKKGEAARWQRHQDLWAAIYEGLDELGFDTIILKEIQSKLVVSVKYPNDPNWNFKEVHDYCYDHGFTISRFSKPPCAIPA